MYVRLYGLKRQNLTVVNHLDIFFQACGFACTLPYFKNHFNHKFLNHKSLFSGRFTVPAFSAYSMSKRACIAFSDALRQEMLKFNVKVVTIEPALYKCVYLR